MLTEIVELVEMRNDEGTALVAPDQVKDFEARGYSVLEPEEPKEPKAPPKVPKEPKAP
jgi:hypothetical protein